MKNEVGTPVVVAIIVVVLLVVGGIAWSMFGKKGGGAVTTDHAQWVREHPESSMSKPPPNPADYMRSQGTRPGSGGQPTYNGQPMTGGR